MAKAYTANRIFTGTGWLSNHTIVTGEGIVTGIVPSNEITREMETQHFDNAMIVPAFIDLQVYGAGSRLFSVYRDRETLQQLYTHNLSGGTVLCLPTIATNTTAVLMECITSTREYISNGGKGILGLHLEGPWINQARKGAHLAELVHPPSINEVELLLDHGKDIIKMITLAPECCDPGIIRLIKSRNIIVSAGHSNASYEEATRGFDQGITTVTHLYNAMSPLLHRNPGFVGAVFNHPSVSASIIPDGIHVDFAAVSIAKKIMKERLFVITDAVTATTEGPYRHERSGDKYHSNGILSGSSLSMVKAVNNLVNHAQVEWGEALRMGSLYPARVLGLDKIIGKIAPGYKACFAVLNQNGQIISTIEDGLLA